MTERYIVSGSLELLAPMHLGDGGDERYGDMQAGVRSGDQEPPPADTHVATVARDKDGKPYVPGSSLKGALRAMSVRLGCAQQWIDQVFGLQSHGGKVLFHSAYCQALPATSGLPTYAPAHGVAIVPSTAIDRVTRTVVDRKLFHVSVVPPTTRFAVTLVACGLREVDLQQLLWLVDQMSTEPLFGLGAGHGESRANVSWRRDAQTVMKFGRHESADWLASLANTDKTWICGAARCHIGPAPVVPGPSTGTQRILRLPVRLAFHAPFLVAQKQRQGADVNIVPRRSHDGQVVLPKSSFVGALRSQCERILSTVGLPTVQGHDCQAHKKGEPFTDLAAILFGAPGWAATLTSSDFTPSDGEIATPPTQEFVAIDRVDGRGGKGHDKYNISRAECPTLGGHLSIDLNRLEGTGKKLEALGLITLLLRDLQEGDISFGYGRSKGFGQCTVTQLLDAWNAQIRIGLNGAGSAECLVAFRKSFTRSSGVSLLKTAAPTAAPQPQPPARVENAFHNPYAFVPFSAPDISTWAEYANLSSSSHSHARYQNLSGRLVFELTTITPIFIGARQVDVNDNSQPKLVEPFELQGQRAIPATSLRGTISALFEQISASNLRVLDDTTLTARVPLGNVTVRKGIDSSVADFVMAENIALLPFGMAALKGKTTRDRLSPAELLFGVVENMGSKSDATDTTDRAARAFAGKVRIGFGRTVGTPRPPLPAITLKELSSAKLPSPSLYFRPSTGSGHVSKKDLVDRPGDYRLKGTKTYLHALRRRNAGAITSAVQRLGDNGAVDDMGRDPWESKFNGLPDEGNNRRVKVAPIGQGQSFFFEVDFDNLDQKELSQLCAALKPFSRFEHKIGMGKSIGLGSVSIEPIGFFLVDRHKRYTTDRLLEERYVRHWGAGRATLPAQLGTEQRLLSTRSTLSVTPLDLANSGFYSVASSNAIRRALHLVGNPAQVFAAVHYPQTLAGTLEHEHYAWFKANEKPRELQHLKDIDRTSTALPTLRRN